MTLPLPLHHSAEVARTLLMIALPGGGQRTARRNAWVGMSRDAAQGRARREADRALDQAARETSHTSHTSAAAGRACWPQPGLRLSR